MSILTQIITVVEKKILFHHHQHDHHHHHRYHHLREHQIDDNTKMTEPVEDISTITVKKRVFRHPPFNSEFSTIFLVYVRGIPLSTCFFPLLFTFGVDLCDAVVVFVVVCCHYIDSSLFHYTLPTTVCLCVHFHSV